MQNLTSGNAMLQVWPDYNTKLLLIGRAKQVPHWAVQSRFYMVYIHICMSTIVYGKPIQKNCILKCVGRIT